MKASIWSLPLFASLRPPKAPPPKRYGHWKAPTKPVKRLTLPGGKSTTIALLCLCLILTGCRSSLPL